MPELPEVENVARGLQPHLPGCRVASARLRHKTLYRRGSLKLGALVGRVVDRVERVGKNVVVRFRPGGLMVINLGMTGRLVIGTVGDRPDIPPKHLHARIRFEDNSELRYYDARRFGHFYVAEVCDFRKDLGVGPDPFVARPRYLQTNLAGRRAPIKALLLDQRILSGIGNIYADETLFRAGMRPTVTGDGAARRAASILQHGRGVLRGAIDHGGSTVRDYRRPDGSSGNFQIHHAVYGREGKPCIRCRTAIEKIVVAGRGTHFCPKCQRLR